MAIRPWGTIAPVNTTTANDQNSSTVAALVNGGYVVAWVDGMGSATSVIKFQRFDALGNKVGLETTLPVADGEGDQINPSIASLRDGGFVIALEDRDGATGEQVHAVRFNASGVMTNDDIASSLQNLPSKAPSVYATSTGYDVLFAIDFGTDNDLQIASYDDTNAKTTNLVENLANVTSDGSGGAFISATNKVAVYTDNTDFVEGGILFFGRVWFKYAPYDGTAVEIDRLYSSAVAIRDVDVFAVGTSYVAITTSEVLGPGGGFVHDAKLLNSSGIELKYFYLPFVQNKGNPGDSVVPQVSGFSDGSFAVVYTDVSGAVRLASYSPTAVLLGSTLLSLGNSTLLGEVSVAKLVDGRLVVTWTDLSNLDTSGHGVFQQIMDLRDGIVDGSNNAAQGETLVGNDALGDVIRGFAGDDTLYGLAGSDVLYGGDGGDILNGGRGDDTLYGEIGIDNMRGDGGDDELYGGVGGDTLIGGLGADFLNGGDGFDFANYHFARGVIIDMNDPLASTGEAFGDSFFSIEGLVGSVGFGDTLLGDVNPNIIYGQGGVDILDGRGGNDTLYGGAAGDTMTGGAGPDRFLYVAATEGGDTITDFAAGDKVQLTASAFGLTANPGAGYPLAPAAFLSGAGHVATTANTRIMVDTTSHTLWYDSDGTGATAAILLATFGNNYNPIIADFLVT
jgi:Ca2+-binding RTX toxin-like protein